MKNVARIFAEKLLKMSAIKLQPDMPFVWASGWNSPIYTDNRRTLSFPDVRTFIKIELTRLILEKFPQVECVAGVATGAIAQGRAGCRRTRPSVCLRALHSQGPRP